MSSKGAAEVVEKAKAERAKRSAERDAAESLAVRTVAVLVLQRFARVVIAKRTLRLLRIATIRSFVERNAQDAAGTFNTISMLFKVQKHGCCKTPAEASLVVDVLRAVCSGLTAPGQSYASLAGTMGVTWIRQYKCLVRLGFDSLPHTNDVLAGQLLKLLVTLTVPDMWLATSTNAGTLASLRSVANIALKAASEKGDLFSIIGHRLLPLVCRVKPGMDGFGLASACSLCTRLLVLDANLCTQFVLHILSLPLFALHVVALCPETIVMVWNTQHVLAKCLAVMDTEQSCRILFHSLDGNKALCLLANMAQLYTALPIESRTKDLSEALIFTSSHLFAHCKRFVFRKASNKTTFHPLFGWFGGQTDRPLQEVLPVVSGQICLLLRPHFISSAFVDLYDESTFYDEKTKRAFINPLACMRIKNSCSLFVLMMSCVPKLRRQVLNAIGYGESSLLPKLWRFLCQVGPKGNLQVFMDSTKHPQREPLFEVLVLFLECTSHLLTVLDDREFYETQQPFKLVEYVALSRFLNHLIFKMLWTDLFSPNEASALKDDNILSLLRASKNLLELLCSRDTRKPFCPAEHWHIPELSTRNAQTELAARSERAKNVLGWIPHALPFLQRFHLLRNTIKSDQMTKIREQSQGAPVVIRRTAMLEDGMRALGGRSAAFLRGTIRVRFVNDQGLDEVGIDQDGVFKEFLEEVIKTAFNPTLGLFTTTPDQQLYPSLTSSFHENHLQLFEFIGKMLGKAVYEGIVVEAPFALFFLSKMLGRLNSFDELSSLDRDLYKQLTFLKSYTGDFADLGLTFSVDEDKLGQVTTHDLQIGGRAIEVCKENCILYVHLMADFRMNKQLRAQCQAFVHGFTQVVDLSWLSMFSPVELNLLISGEDTPLDLRDLRQNIIYYGGYHDRHKVIQWLFETLESFDSEHRSLFLKFVTSCSKAPVLGFAHLEPKFAIRCVEDEDDGYLVNTSLSGVMRSLFSSGTETQRLPTSSTCFNLLKLPRYSKKSTLKERLLYAIRANAGFELS